MKRIRVKYIAIIIMFIVIGGLSMRNLQPTSAKSRVEDYPVVKIDDKLEIDIDEEEENLEPTQMDCLACIILGIKTTVNQLHIVATQMNVINPIITTNCMCDQVFSIVEQE